MMFENYISKSTPIPKDINDNAQPPPPNFPRTYLSINTKPVNRDIQRSHTHPWVLIAYKETKFISPVAEPATNKLQSRANTNIALELYHSV
ncbi:hypothetical protein CDAR_533331 [Caerostris darwini]|uniref:Uncharacterized protein n=1 Tax=Caerostris darwini TaxID=1538125 RepID=A0AAV4RNN4_9ARAC|nr:hypothetical protein CDAR_533331 [Caerostris darwini]